MKYRGVNKGIAWPKIMGLHDVGNIEKKKLIPLLVGVVVVVALLVYIIALMFFGDQKSTRTESYQKASGVAGLATTITYDVHCDKQPCEQKPTFDFNVYLFNDKGQQINVVRPDKDGKVNAALPEGNYIMLIGKQFSKDKLFPQEPMILKNGQVLELKLHYR